MLDTAERVFRELQLQERRCKAELTANACSGTLRRNLDAKLRSLEGRREAAAVNVRAAQARLTAEKTAAGLVRQQFRCEQNSAIAAMEDMTRRRPLGKCPSSSTQSLQEVSVSTTHGGQHGVRSSTPQRPGTVSPGVSRRTPPPEGTGQTTNARRPTASSTASRQGNSSPPPHPGRPARNSPERSHTDSGASGSKETHLRSPARLGGRGSATAHPRSGGGSVNIRGGAPPPPTSSLATAATASSAGRGIAVKHGMQRESRSLSPSSLNASRDDPLQRSRENVPQRREEPVSPPSSVGSALRDHIASGSHAIVVTGSRSQSPLSAQARGSGIGSGGRYTGGGSSFTVAPGGSGSRAASPPVTTGPVYADNRTPTRCRANSLARPRTEGRVSPPLRTTIYSSAKGSFSSTPSLPSTPAAGVDSPRASRSASSSTNFITAAGGGGSVTAPVITEEFSQRMFAEVLQDAEELKAKLAAMPEPLRQQLVLQSAGLRCLLQEPSEASATPAPSPPSGIVIMDTE